MSSVAVIGLGIMGLPMATNLVRAGFDVSGFNRSPGRIAELEKSGGRASDSVAAAVREADVVVTVLPDTPDVQAVYGGPGGVIANARRGALLIDCSTINPAASVTLAQQASAERGLDALDAPVSGGELGAINGALSIMVGGSESGFERAAPIFGALGSTIKHVGGNGAGQTVKAANQLIVGGIIQLVSEALVFLTAKGVDLDPSIEVLSGGLAGNAVLERKAASMVGHEFVPGFRIDLHHKDMTIMVDAARESGIAVPLGLHVLELLSSARDLGLGGLDHTALLQQVEELSGGVRS